MANNKQETLIMFQKHNNNTKFPSLNQLMQPHESCQKQKLILAINKWEILIMSQQHNYNTRFPSQNQLMQLYESC